MERFLCSTGLWPPSWFRWEFFGRSGAGSAFSHHPGSFRLSFSLCRASEARRNALAITTNTLTSLPVVCFGRLRGPTPRNFDSFRTLQASALAGRAYPASGTLFAACPLIHSLRILSDHHPVTVRVLSSHLQKLQDLVHLAHPCICTSSLAIMITL